MSENILWYMLQINLELLKINKAVLTTEPFDFKNSADTCIGGPENSSGMWNVSR